MSTVETLPVVATRSDAPPPCTCGLVGNRPKHHESTCPVWIRYCRILDAKVRSMTGLSPTADDFLVRCSEESPLELLQQMSTAVDAEWERAKANKQLRDELFTEVVKSRGPFTLGTVRYWLSHPKTTKAKSLLALMRAVLEATGGDEEAFSRALSANAFKVGVCRSLLLDSFDDHFETVIKDRLESGEVAPKELTSADVQWMSK